MERRLLDSSRSSSLPLDYLKMVVDVFATNFATGLKALTQIAQTPMAFQAHGEIFATEILLAVTLKSKDHTRATTVYASCDFDPKASSPTAQELLGNCVDAIGGIFGQFLIDPSPEVLEQLAGQSLWNMENIPFHWTPVEVEKRVLYLKVDRSNPELDQMADDWLEKHDPDLKQRKEQEHRDTEKLFVTGSKAKKSKLH